jgi:hypothetical protein
MPTDFLNTNTCSQETNILKINYMNFQDNVKHVSDNITGTCCTLHFIHENRRSISPPRMYLDLCFDIVDFT